MSLNVSTQLLRSLIVLTEKKAALEAELARVDAQLQAAFSGSSAKVPAARGPKAVSAKKSTVKVGRKGGVKELILDALATAGTAGIAVKDLAANLGLKPQNVHVWFHTTGKKHAERASKGIYRLKSAAKTAAPKVEAPVEAPKAVKKAAPKKGKAKSK